MNNFLLGWIKVPILEHFKAIKNKKIKQMVKAGTWAPKIKKSKKRSLPKTSPPQDQEIVEQPTKRPRIVTAIEKGLNSPFFFFVFLSTFFLFFSLCFFFFINLNLGESENDEDMGGKDGTPENGSSDIAGLCIPFELFFLFFYHHLEPIIIINQDEEMGEKPRSPVGLDAIVMEKKIFQFIASVCPTTCLHDLTNLG